MQISEFGGEFKLIQALTQDFPKFSSKIIQGVGDDAAVLDAGEYYQLLATDTLVENDHFNLKWSTGAQIGQKAVEVNVSDIIACGGIPQAILVTLVLPPQIDVAIVQAIYSGIKKTCQKYQLDLLGGDTTHGSELVITVTILGRVQKQNLRLRSRAKPDDLICVTGDLGGSAAGLHFLKKFNDPQTLQTKFPYLFKRHLEPCVRFDLAQKIVPYSNALIDVSDGLASEVRHICTQSRRGAAIEKDQIPLHPETKLCAEILGEDAYTWALSGGEDFELVFTCAPKQLEKLQKTLSAEERKKITVVGKILADAEKIHLLKGKDKYKLPDGYDHFQ